MSVKDVNNILLPRAYSYACPSNPFPDIPIPPEERRRPPIQRISDHRALLNRPATQNHQPSTKRATVIELPIRQNLPRRLPDVPVVILHPAFL